jgi:ribosomal protein L7/L12
MTVEFESLNEVDKAQVIDVCMSMLRTMTTIFGLEKGEEMYGTIADACGQDIKGAVLFAMLTGHHSGVTLHDARQVNAYVELIKTVRTHTGYGLKEAKDACDLARVGTAVKFTVDAKSRHLFLKDLHKISGVIAS